jgi:hypothetical protein
VLLRGRSRDGLYVLDAPAAPVAPTTPQVFSGVRAAPSQWHARLGHPATPVVRHVLRRHDLPFVYSTTTPSVCDACQ